MPAKLISPSVYEYRYAVLQSWQVELDLPRALPLERRRRSQRRPNLTRDDITFMPGPARPEPSDDHDHS